MKIGGRWIRIDTSTLRVNTGDLLSVSIDNNTIISSSNQLTVGPHSITRNHIYFDVGSTGVNASVIPIVNVNGNYGSSIYIEDALEMIANKHFVVRYGHDNFSNVQAVLNNGDSRRDVTSIITSSIPNHNNGNGSAVAEGVVIKDIKYYQIPIRNASTKEPVRTQAGDEIVATLTYSDGVYFLEYINERTGQPYNGFTTADRIDFGYVLYSSKFLNIPWSNIFVDESWQNVAVAASMLDDNILVNGMQYFLSGVTNQAQANQRVDGLGDHTRGTRYIAYNPENNNYYGTEPLFLGSVLHRIASTLGGTSWDNRNYSESNYISSSDDLTRSIDKLDAKIHDFTTTNEGEGASLIGIHDKDDFFRAENVEDALMELYRLASSGKVKTKYITLTSNDISNGYVPLPDLVKESSTVGGNIVLPENLIVDCMQGASGDSSEFVIIRNTSETTDFFVFKNEVTPPGCSPTTYSINTSEFGDLLESGFVLRFAYTTK